MSAAYLPPQNNIPAGLPTPDKGSTNVQGRVTILSMAVGVFVGLLAIIFTILDTWLKLHTFIWSIALYGMPLGFVSFSLINYRLSQMVKTRVGLYLGILFAVIMPLLYIFLYVINVNCADLRLIVFAFLSLPINISGIVFIGRYLFNSPSMESTQYRGKVGILTLSFCILFLVSFMNMDEFYIDNFLFYIMFFQLYCCAPATIFSLLVGVSNRRFLKKLRKKAAQSGAKVENSLGWNLLIYSNIVLGIFCFIATILEIAFIIVVTILLLFIGSVSVF